MPVSHPARVGRGWVTTTRGQVQGGPRGRHHPSVGACPRFSRAQGVLSPVPKAQEEHR